MKLRSFLLFRWITDFLKGMLIGISMLIPGISGGTMAIILGIYNDLIGAVSGFFRSKGKSIFLLIRVGAGLCIGAALLSEKLIMLFRLFPELSVFFFIGAISGSLPMLLRESGLKADKLHMLIFAVIGAAAVFILKLLPENVITLYSGGGTYFISGIVIAAALVLPGISTSHMLLVLGLYEKVWQSVSAIDLSVIIPMAAGGIIGTFLTAKAAEIIQRKYPCAFFLTISGFVCASGCELLPESVPERLLPICLIMLLTGFLLVSGLSRKQKLSEEKKKSVICREIQHS